uniref:Uncharacterized protein n=1 Tax=Ditylenchus dipsaci TaxID=166011 RepID=A0A915DWL4_9BILA
MWQRSLSKLSRKSLLFSRVNESSGVNVSKMSTMQIVFISIGGAIAFLCVLAILGFVLWCRRKGYRKKKRSPLPVSSLPPPVSSPPLMVVSCISSTEKPPKTAVPVSSNEKPNTSEALANASKQVTERTTEAVTVDPHTGAKQPKKLTKHNSGSRHRVYETCERERVKLVKRLKKLLGNTEAETAITEKTLDPHSKVGGYSEISGCHSEISGCYENNRSHSESVGAKNTVEATQKTQEANKPGVGKH